MISKQSEVKLEKKLTYICVYLWGVIAQIDQRLVGAGGRGYIREACRVLG